MKQTITAATIQLKREVAWAAQRTRLLASLAGVPRSLGRDLAKATEFVLGRLREHQYPINIQFDLHHLDNGQRVQIGLAQLVQTEERDRLSEEFNQIVEAARSLNLDIRSKSDCRQDGLLLSATLSVDVPQGQPISREVATQWATALASGSADSALAESQRRLGALATRLQHERKRGADLEQEVAGLKRLNETLELLALVASNTVNGVIIADAQGRIEWINESFQRMTGMELAEVIKVPLVDVMHGADSTSGVAGELCAAIAAGNATSQDILHRRKNGETFWASLSITPVFDEQGKVTRWIGMAQDVTQQRHAQEMLNRAKKRAEEANQAKSDFLANVSHEIRTPMNAIIGMVELLLDTKLDEMQHDYISIVHDSSVKLLQLLNDILDLSKIEARQLAIHAVEFSLYDSLNSAVAPFRPMAKQAGVELTITKDEDVPDLLIGDPIRLRQIVMNLVGNAVKFTPRGVISIRIQQIAGDDVTGDEESVRLQFCVRDTGIGIAEQDLSQIFRAFTQADSSAARQYGGTGLGLAICAELAELMDGRLWAQSESGVSSEFYFECSFLVPQSSSSVEGTPFVSSEDVETLSDNANALRILVADDHAPNRLLLRRILEKCNHFVDEASDGVDAIRMIEKQPYDLVLLDIQMPNLDGVEVARRLRSLADELPSTPRLIAVTANAMQGDREKYLSLGLDDYLAKPISARRLLSLIAKWTVSESQMANLPTVGEVPSSKDYIVAVGQSVETDSTFVKALKRLEGDRELLVEQMQFYLEDVTILIRDIIDAINESDHRRLELAAHRIKGLAKSFDCEPLAKVCQDLESIGHSGDLSTALPLISRLTSANESLVLSIRGYLKGKPPLGP